MTHHSTFKHAIDHAFTAMRHSGKLVHRGKWQGVDVSQRPEMAAYELLHYHIIVPMLFRNIDPYRKEIAPNLPWADNHFMERVCGFGINPGHEWKNWPWGKNAEKFLMPNGLFDHNYMERYWPKFAGSFDGTEVGENSLPTITSQQFAFEMKEAGILEDHPNRGYRYDYGDLDDVVQELIEEPTTRQAILPVFFPEDTGHRPGRRKPCSISYHFLKTGENKLDIFYHLRSCDLVRHFRDDIYLTVRLLLWVLDQCRSRSPGWEDAYPGNFVMYIGNLHCFKNDMIALEQGRKL